MGALLRRALPLHRIRDPRKLLTAFLAAGVTAAWIMLFGRAARGFAEWIPSDPLRRLTLLLGFAALELGSVALIARLALGEPIQAMLPSRAGLGRWLVRGVGIGIIASGFPPAVLTFLDKGWIAPHPPMERGAVAAAVLSLPVGVLWEEAVYRGGILRWLNPLGTLPAVLLSAALFAGLHFLAEPFVPIRLALLFALGVLFAVACRSAGDLWFPIGTHLGLNFVGLVLANDPLAGGIWRFEVDASPGALLGVSLAGVALATALAALLPRALRRRHVSIP